MDMVNNDLEIMTICPGDAMILNLLLVTDFAGDHDCGCHWALPWGILRDVAFPHKVESSWRRMYLSTLGSHRLRQVPYSRSIDVIVRMTGEPTFDWTVRMFDHGSEYWNAKLLDVVKAAECEATKGGGKAIDWKYARLDLFDWTMEYWRYKKCEHLESKAGGKTWWEIDEDPLLKKTPICGKILEEFLSDCGPEYDSEGVIYS